MAPLANEQSRPLPPAYQSLAIQSEVRRWHWYSEVALLSQDWAAVSRGTTAPQIEALEPEFWGVKWGEGLPEYPQALDIQGNMVFK